MSNPSPPVQGPLRFFISAGEVSGDMHAAELMKHLSDENHIEFYGLGGPAMKAQGLKGVDDDASILNTIGHIESLRFIGRKLRHLKQSLQIMEQYSIRHLILVDNQGFNLILGEKAQKRGIEVFYYIPPRVSVWGAWNASKVARIARHILPFLVSDLPLYQPYAEHLFYPGNPVMDKIAEFQPLPQFKQVYGLQPGRPVAGIFPGSRDQEIRTLLPEFLKAAGRLIRDLDCQILLSVAHPEFLQRIRAEVDRAELGREIRLVVGSPLQVMYASDINIMASGTATLESALLGRMPVICYRISPLSYWIAKRLVIKKMIGLPNILLDQKYFPELLQAEMNADRLLELVREHFAKKESEQEQDRSRYERLRTLCGEPGAAARAAQYIREAASDAAHTGH